MRLVRGSIVASKPCSLSKAAAILRLFLSSDAGADISARRFLKSAAHSLESIRDGERSSHKKSKSKREKRKLDRENSPVISAPKDEIAGPSFGGHDHQPRESVPATKEDGKHSHKRSKGSKKRTSEMAAEVEVDPEEHHSKKKTRSGSENRLLSVVKKATFKRSVSQGV